MLSIQDLEAFKLRALPDAIYYVPDFLTPAEEAALSASIPAKRWISLSRRRLQAWPSQLTARNNVLVAQPLPGWLDPVVEKLRPLGLFGVGGQVGIGGAERNGSHDPHRDENREPAVYAPNHVLINEYLPGQGIFPHTDGPAYADCVATVSLGTGIVLDIYDPPVSDRTVDKDNETDGVSHGVPISTSSSRTELEPSAPSDSKFQSNPSKFFRCPRARIFQEPRSLLITTGSAYRDTEHGIAETTVDEDLNEHTVANWYSLDAQLRERIEADSGRYVRVDTRTSLTFRRVLRTSNVANRLFKSRT